MELQVNIHKRFNGFELLVSFNVKDDVYGLLGASGSGKSMILRCIAGLETPDEGRIVLNNRVLFDSEKKINLPPRKRNVGLLFQNYALFPHMTVEENIRFGLYQASKALQIKKTSEIISMLKLEGLEKRFPRELSGGQQQRVALARALAIEPEALLLDEPFSALDNHLKSQVERQLIENLESFSGTTIFVTHNMDEAYRVCKNLIIIDNGEILARGGKKQIFDNPPNKKAAEITGCKNISKVKVISPSEAEAVDWGIRFIINKDTAAMPQYLGIRSNHIAIADRDNYENVIKCYVVETTETPSHMTAYLSVKPPTNGSKDFQLQWEVPKDKWDELITKPQPWSIYINKDKFFLMESQLSCHLLN